MPLTRTPGTGGGRRTGLLRRWPIGEGSFTDLGAQVEAQVVELTQRLEAASRLSDARMPVKGESPARRRPAGLLVGWTGWDLNPRPPPCHSIQAAAGNGDPAVSGGSAAVSAVRVWVRMGGCGAVSDPFWTHAARGRRGRRKPLCVTGAACSGCPFDRLAILRGTVSRSSGSVEPARGDPRCRARLGKRGRRSGEARPECRSRSTAVRAAPVGTRRCERHVV